MLNFKNYIIFYKTLWSLLKEEKKKLFFIYIFLSFFISLLEILSLILFINIIQYFVSGNLPILLKINYYTILDKLTINELAYLAIILFLFISLLLVLTKFIENRVNCKISYETVYDFDTLIFKKLSMLNFLKHKKIDINLSISNFTKVNEMIQVLLSNLAALSSIITSSIILFFLLMIDFYFVLVSIFLLLIIYFILAKISKKNLFMNSQIISKNINTKTLIISQLMGSIRNVTIDKLQNYFVKNFNDVGMALKNSRISTAQISFLPSIIFTHLFLFFAIIILLINTYLQNNVVEDISKFVALALGAQKLVNSYNKTYIAVSKTRGSYYNILSVFKFIKFLKRNINYQNESKLLKLFTREKIVNIKILVKKNLVLNKINFKYSDKYWIFNKLNLNIESGEKILIQGPSGSGKTTLVDILIGLILPNTGTLKVDNLVINKKNLEQYQNNVSLIPQEIPISEQSFLQNIAFGINPNSIDLKRVQWCAKIAEIDKLIMSTSKKYNSIVSHNGSNLSGGQKQRIGIARGLYKNSDILIFDESTNSLDEETEKKIFSNFNEHLKNKIIIFVSHDKKNLKFFDKIYTLQNGKLKKKILK